MSDAFERRQRRQRPLGPGDPRRSTRTRQGLAPVEVAQLHAQQDGRCAICRKPLPARYVVDHDHALAGAHGHDPKVGCRWCVRGLLDYTCNKLLGLARDDADALRRASVYVAWRRSRAAS